MSRTIRLLVLDLDGVITDGTIQLHPSGDELRTIHFHDLDAVGAARRRGVDVAILSGEDSPSSQRVAARFGIDETVWGAKDKGPALHALTTRLGISLSETCYVGDSDRDAPALEAAALGLAPANASARARAAADEVLTATGGHGAVAEAVELLERTGSFPA